MSLKDYVNSVLRNCMKLRMLFKICLIGEWSIVIVKKYILFAHEFMFGISDIVNINCKN